MDTAYQMIPSLHHLITIQHLVDYIVLRTWHGLICMMIRDSLGAPVCIHIKTLCVGIDIVAFQEKNVKLIKLN